MIETILKEIDNSGLVDWGVLLLGAKGLPIGQISIQFISDYAVKRLIKIDPNDPEFIINSDLCLHKSIDADLIEELSQLCGLSGVDIDKSKMKWVVFALIDLLQKLGNDYIYGILEINNFWNEWGDFKGSPNLIQGVDNYISPDDFYTKTNYENIINSNWSWANSELFKLMH